MNVADLFLDFFLHHLFSCFIWASLTVAEQLILLEQWNYPAQAVAFLAVYNADLS